MTTSAPIALVTGAGQRIGRALALTLGQRGYDIVVHYRRSEDAARNVADEIQSLGRRAALVRADLASPDETASVIAAAKNALGAPSLLVNSASTFEPDEVTTFTRESWKAHMGPNLYAPLKLSQDFANAIPPGSDANSQIVNIIDQRVLKLTPQFFTYTLSKAALWSATQTMAQALGPVGIRVNAIAPGPVLKNPRQSDDDWKRQNEATVLGRGATPDDMSAALCYLLDAPAVTGQLLLVDGGQHLAWQTPDVLVNE